MSLLALPPELRERIYYYVPPCKQSDSLEYLGNGRERLDYDWCLPLRKVRPPALIRVCRTIRCEYLPFYLKSTCFRIHVDIQSTKSNEAGTPSMPGIAAWPATAHWTMPSALFSRSAMARDQGQPPDETILDKLANEWLDNLGSKDGVRFRQIHIRFVNSEGRVIGAGLTITYNSRDRKYEIDFKFDQGWPEGIRCTIIRMGLRYNITVGPEEVSKRLRDMCDFSREEVLDWKALEYLMDALQVDNLETGPFANLVGWQDDRSWEVNLLKA